MTPPPIDSLDTIPTTDRKADKADAAPSSSNAPGPTHSGGIIFGVDSSRVKYGNTSAKAKAKAKRQAAAAAEAAGEPRHYNAAKIAGMLRRPVVNCL